MRQSSGLLNYDVLHANGICQGTEHILLECKESLESFYGQVKGKLSTYKNVLHAIAETLLEKETLDEEQLEQIIIQHNVNIKETA